LAGLAEASVLTAIATFVREHAELELGDLLPAMEKVTETSTNDRKSGAAA